MSAIGNSVEKIVAMRTPVTRQVPMYDADSLKTDTKVSEPEEKRAEQLEKIEAKINYLGTFKDGWSHGAGKSFDSRWLQRFKELLEKNYPADLPVARFYPLADGGASLLWDTPRGSVYLDIEDGFENAYFDIIDDKYDTTVTKVVDLASPEQWRDISKAVKALSQNS